MPQDLSPYLPYATALGSFALGALITLLATSSRRARLEERCASEERAHAELKARLAAATEETLHSSRHAQALQQQLTEARTRLEEETKAATARQALLDRAEQRLSDTFKALSADALKTSSDQFLQLARTSLQSHHEEARGDLQQRQSAIENLVKPVTETLNRFENRIGDLEKIRESAYAELRTQVKTLTESQALLQRETASLVKALRQPTGRGQWGEIQLRRVVEMAGMQPHCDFHTQTTTTNDEGKRLRPDLIVHLPGDKTIVVDAKTPMDAYLDALESTDDTLREQALLRHAHQVRRHIAQLASKNYTSQFTSSPEFTVLFLPSESFFSAALHADPTLIEHGVNQNIILATPTTLIALLRAVAYGWRQETLTENAREISKLGRSLHERLHTLTTHFAKLGRSLESTVTHYNQSVASLETRVLITARKFEDLQVAPEDKPLETLTSIDLTPRLPTDTSTDTSTAPLPRTTNAQSAAADLLSALHSPPPNDPTPAE